jgi:hypothetical protein
MKIRSLIAPAALWTACLLLSVSALAAETPAPAAKKHAATQKAKKEPQPGIQEQIQALRQQMESQASQIEALKARMAEKDARLKQAEETAADAQASAAKLRSELLNQQSAANENAASVTALQNALSGLKANQSELARSYAEDSTRVRAALANPTAFRYKGLSLTPTGFVTLDTFWRAHGTGGGVATPFSVIPYEHGDAYSLSEAGLSGQQTRLGLIMEGKVPWGTLRAYVEGDFLASATMSNANESNSYVYRQRVTMAEAETNSHLSFAGGLGWTLATENLKGISIAPANIGNPIQIDPNFEIGFVWLRGGNFRVTRSYPHMAFAASLENPQLLYTASLAGNTPYAVLGSQGVSGSFFNGAISSCAVSTSVVNYANQSEGTLNIALPVTKTVSSCTNLANISFNQAPDVLVKAAFDPGRGHYEIFGIARFGHETVYPGETTNSYLYGGKDPNGNTIVDIETGSAVAPALSAAGAFRDSIVLGGIGGSLRIPIVPNKLTIGAKGLYGPGVGRYGPTTLPDVTANSKGLFEPIHDGSGLATVEAFPIPRLQIYSYYGVDYAGRADFGNASTTTSLAAPTAVFCPTGSSTCSATPATTASGSWGAHWAAPAAAPVGYGSRLLSNSACLTNANPGYSGASTGFYPGASCGAQTRDMQELTLGYWYDMYRGDRGRLRQGFQYSYLVRESWSGASGIGTKGIEPMLFTSLRYYLP